MVMIYILLSIAFGLSVDKAGTFTREDFSRKPNSDLEKCIPTISENCNVQKEDFYASLGEIKNTTSSYKTSANALESFDPSSAGFLGLMAVKVANAAISVERLIQLRKFKVHLQSNIEQVQRLRDSACIFAPPGTSWRAGRTLE